MRIVCISGKARHGKNATADALRDILEGDGKSVLIAQYGDLVKYICKTFFGWNGEKDEYGRTLLQRVGTDIVRTEDADYWVNFIISVLKFFQNEWDYVLIPDCRFPNEIESMREHFIVSHVRVCRPDFMSDLTPEQLAHPSETSLDGYPTDHYIVNDGDLEDLRRKVVEFVHGLNGERQNHTEEI